MQKTSKEFCRKCKYSWLQNNTMDYSVLCHYILTTKKRRGCPVGYCDKFESREERRK